MIAVEYLNYAKFIKKGQRVTDNLYFFSEKSNSIFTDCNQIVIVNERTNELSVFDAGNALSLKGLEKGLRELSLDPKNITNVFLTHEHVDHILGIYKMITENYDIKIHAFGKTVEILESGDKKQIFPLGGDPQKFGVKITPLKIVNMTKMENIRVSPEYEFQIFQTPGHSEGSICYYESQKKILISGDLIFKNGVGKYDLFHSSIPALKDSLARIKNLDIKYILCGHGDLIENPKDIIEKISNQNFL